MNFRRGAIIAVAAAAVFASAGSLGDTLRQLTWDDLLPPSLLQLEKEAILLGGQLRKLSPGERMRYDEVARELQILDSLADGTMKRDELSDTELALLARKPGDAMPKARDFWKKFSQAQARVVEQGDAVDPNLNGSRVRIPGYALPLEFEGSKIREFLLVPYVGACVHTPPPPANQMVFVRLNQSFESQGLYTPVWVEGRMLTQSGSHNLSLVDGSRSVDAGYTLEADAIEPYKQ